MLRTDNGTTHFVHAVALTQFVDLSLGDSFSFCIAQDKLGREGATDLTLVRRNPHPTPQNRVQLRGRPVAKAAAEAAFKPAAEFEQRRPSAGPVCFGSLFK